MRNRRLPLTALVLVLGLIALVATGAAGAKHKPKAVTVYKLRLDPKQEVPTIHGLKAHADGSLTLDVTRDASGTITSGNVVFYFNYDFPGAVTITGLHVHQAPKHVNGAIVISSGVSSIIDADGEGNVTAVVTGVLPSLLQSILSNPKAFYVNLHTTTYPGGSMRDQLKK
jgi:hypothetical protein